MSRYTRPDLERCRQTAAKRAPAELQRSRQNHASSLLDHDLVTGPVNCLALAVKHGREASGSEPGDDLAFFSAPHGRPGPGHVALRCVASGAVREPGAAGPAASTAAAYAAATGRRLLASAPVSTVRTILRRPLAKRTASLSEAGRAVNCVAHLAFGIGPGTAYPPGTGPESIPPDPPHDYNDAVHEWLDSLGNAVSDKEKKQLAEPADDAQKVYEWFEKHERDAPALDHPPPDIAAAEQRLMSSGVIRNLLDAQPGSRIVITRDTLQNFLEHLEGAADSARDSYEAFKEANPDHDPLSMKQAVNASILQANLPILDQADKSGVDADDQFNRADLDAIADPQGENTALSNPLKSAADFYDDPDNYNYIAKWSPWPDTQSDSNLIDNDKIGGYVESDFPNFHTKYKDDGDPGGNFFDADDPQVKIDVQVDKVNDWLASLGISISEEEKDELFQPTKDIANVLDWFYAHDRDDPKIDHPPPDVAESWGRLLKNDVISQHLDAEPGGKGVLVTRDTLQSLLDDLGEAADHARDSWEKFREDNPNPDKLTLRQAFDASILQANLPLLDQADKPGLDADGQFNRADLRTVADSSGGTEGLPGLLRSAAGYYSEPGTYNILTDANTNPIPPSPPAVDSDHIDTYLESLTPSNTGDAEQAVGHAAIVKTVKDAGGDPNVLSPEDFYGPDMTSQDREKYPSDMPLGTYLGNSKASPADKAATLLQLSELYGKLKAGEKWLDATSHDSSSFERAFEAQGMTLRQFTGMLKTSIDTLSQDPEVVEFFKEKFPQGIASIVGQDPKIKSHYQKVFDDNTTGGDLDRALEPVTLGSIVYGGPPVGPGGSRFPGGLPDSLPDAFASKKTPLVTQAITGFINNVTEYAQALGLKPEEFKARMEKAYADASPATQKAIQQGYEDLTSGARVKELIKAGESPAKAVAQASQELISYNSILPINMVKKGTQEFVDHNNKIARNELTDGKTVAEMLEGFGIDGLNDPQLRDFIKKHYDELVPPGGFQPSVDEIVLGLRGISDTFRGVRKFDLAIKNLQKRADAGVLPPKLQRAYSSGALHAASALILGGALADRGINSSVTPVVLASNALTAAGLLLDSAGKRWAFKLNAQVELTEKQYKFLTRPGSNATEAQIESAKKRFEEAKARKEKWLKTAAALEDHGGYLPGIAGAATGAAAGAFLLADAIKSGDTGSIILNSIGTSLSAMSAVTQTAEYAPKVITNLPKVVGYWGHFFGAITNVASSLFGVGLLAYIAVEQITALNDYSHNAGVLYDEVRDGASPFIDLYDERQLGETNQGNPVWRW